MLAYLSRDSSPNPEELLQEPWGLIVKSEKQGITEDQLSIQEIFDFKL